MKKVIKGVMYNTETAREVGSDSFSNPRDFHFWEEKLFRKKTGEYFLYGCGGPASRYAVDLGNNGWSGGEKITPLTCDAAREWAEEHLDGDEYEKLFEVSEDNQSKRLANFSLPENIIEKIKRKSVEKQISMSEYITLLVERDVE